MAVWVEIVFLFHVCVRLYASRPGSVERLISLAVASRGVAKW